MGDSGPRALRVGLGAVALLLLRAAAYAAADAEPAVATLSRGVVPAAGSQTAILTVTHFGRYALTVTSKQGTALQLVDRMAGPGTIEGSAGERDGRLDVFLDRGEYKIVTYGDARSGGDARLAVHPFIEKQTPRPPRLVELKLVEAELHDLEQVSYWVEIETRRPVSFEAAGRALTDLRLWRDGEWLVDASPSREYVQPTVGHPLFALRLATTLDPGLYLLTAYGGPPQPWAEESGAHPFYLRSGIPKLGEATRARYVTGPFGIDRFRIPGGSNYLRLELPEATALAATVRTFDATRPFDTGAEAQLAITKKSVPPVAETELNAQTAERLVTIRADAGQPYVFQSFARRDRYPFSASGPHWVSTVPAGQAVDSVDATAILMDTYGIGEGQHIQPVAASVVELDGKTGWARRANLLDTLTVFLQVKEAGAYAVSSKGTPARFRIEPFMVSPPAHYKTPPFRDAGGKWDLDAGFYVLTVEPMQKGILDAAIKPVALLDDLLKAVGLGHETAARAVQAAVRFPNIDLQGHQYVLFANRQPGVVTGAIVRSLPLDLEDALPLSLRPGETVSIAFRAGEAGTLSAMGEDGRHAGLAVDGGPWQDAVTVTAGEHTVVVRHTGRETLSFSLGLLPRALDPQTPLPEMPDTALAGLPDYPVVAEKAPRFYDLVSRGTGIFKVRADKPGLYRLETNGLLSLQMNLRTRTVVSFAEARENGTGRNALLQQYLREGDYQGTVQALGRSAGHGGIELSRSEPAAGGFLTSGVPARATIRPGEAVSYRFNITKPGRFHLRALALGRKLRCRLEDADGWPIVPPNGEADITRDFEPGRYRLVVLPENATTRVVTVLGSLGEAPKRTGHGPHRLALDERATLLWLEPDEGGERRPDVWEWRVPAPVQARVMLTNDMEGELVALGEHDEKTRVASISARQEWTGTLGPGRYQLAAICSRRNNQVLYDVQMSATELTAGRDREVTAPVDVPIAVGEAGLVELSSFGTADVKARLFDSSGRQVAENDDRPDDWNFLLVQNLDPGLYRLRVDAVGSTSGRTRVSFRVPRDEPQPSLPIPVERDVTLRRAAWLYPVTVPDGAEILTADARSSSNVGIALEIQVGSAWRRVATAAGRRLRIAVPLGEPRGASYRLRVWSLDRRESTVHLRLAAPRPLVASEERFRKGMPLSPPPDATDVVRVDLDRPGVFRVADAGMWLWCVDRGRACAPPDRDLVAAPGRTLWVVRAKVPEAAPPALRGERVRLGAGNAVTVRLAPEAQLSCDMADHDGPVLLFASSQVETPGVRAVRRGEVAQPRGDTMAVGAHTAVGVTLEGRAASALLWPASGTEPFEITLESRPYARPRRLRVESGTWEGALEGEQTAALQLPSGWKRLRLSAGSDVVAALVSGESVNSVHWNDGKPFVETVDTNASEVLLLRTRPGRGLASIRIVPLPEDERVRELLPDEPYEHAQTQAGWLRLSIPAGLAAGSQWHVRGADGDAVFVSARGNVVRGSDRPVDPEGGTLRVPHRTGWVLGWIDHTGVADAGLWGGEAEGRAIKATPPAIVPLEGTSRVLTFDVARPAMVHVRSASALVTRLDRAAAPSQVEVHPTGVSYDAYLPGGRGTLWLRALGGGPLLGTAEITTSEVVAVGEGLGPEVLLGAGDSRTFSFHVQRSGPVGVGVRASAELVEAVVLNEQGQVVGTGPAQMLTLDPGTYLLVLRTPVDQPPVNVRPALVGLTLPDTGPPPDVVESYRVPESSGQSWARIRDEVMRGAAAPAEAGEGEGDEGVVPDEAGEGGEQ